MNFNQNNGKMGPQQSKQPERDTYLLYVLDGNGKPEKIAGPFFFNELQQGKEKFFNEFGDDVRMTNEYIFRTFHEKHYLTHIKRFWMDKLFCYFCNNQDWIGSVYIIPQERAFVGQWFTLNECFKDGEQVLRVDVQITANKFFAPRLLFEIGLNVPIKVVLGVDYYEGSNKRMYTGDRAFQRLLAEDLINSLRSSKGN